MEAAMAANVAAALAEEEARRTHADRLGGAIIYVDDRTVTVNLGAGGEFSVLRRDDGRWVLDTDSDSISFRSASAVLASIDD